MTHEELLKKLIEALKPFALSAEDPDVKYSSGENHIMIENDYYCEQIWVEKGRYLKSGDLIKAKKVYDEVKEALNE